MLVGFHAIRIDNTVSIASSDGSVISELPYIATLLDKYCNDQCVVYDVDYFAACIIQSLDLTIEQAKRLHEHGKIIIDGYKIVYFPDAFFAISYGLWLGHPEIEFRNMAQDGYLKPIYKECETIDDALAKAKEAKEVAINVSKAFEYIKLKTDNISSPIRAFIKQHPLNWATKADYPTEIDKMAWEAMKGQWFSTSTMGLFDNCYLWDINGSYGYELTKLPDIRRGKFIESTTIPDGAVLGISSGILETNSDFHPFLVKKNGANHSPTGIFPCTMGLEAIKLLKEYNLGKYTIEKGWWWIPTDTIHNVYRGTILYLWNKKLEATNDYDKGICKRVYGALWGLMGQYIPDKKIFGKYVNHFIHYIVEENSRCHVARTCLEQGIHPLLIAGDGFVTDKKLSLTSSKEIGQWKLAKQGKCLIASSGGIAFESNEPPKGLSFHYNSLIKQMVENPKLKSYGGVKCSPVTLGLALTTNYNDLGNLHKIGRSLTIGNNTDRDFFDKPKIGKDLLSGKIYNSMPWSFNDLSLIEQISSKSNELV